MIQGEGALGWCGMRFKRLIFITVAMVALAGCGPNGETSETQMPSGPTSSEEVQSEEEEQTVRFSEVIRSIFYAPNYVALEKGFFEQEGLNVEMVTAQGSDKGVAALLAGTADISLIGPETAIYVNKEKGAQEVRAFYQLTGTDGSFLLSREAFDTFSFTRLEGESVISWRPGSAPEMVMASVLRNHDVRAERITNIAPQAMAGAFKSGKADFIQVYEPVASMLERSGHAHMDASMGEAIGPFPETSYVATASFLQENPELVQKWADAVYRARMWMEKRTPKEIARVLQPYFEGTDLELITLSVERYLRQATWPENPVMTKEQYRLLEKVLIENGVLQEDETIPYEDAVDPSFAKETLRNNES